jgi:cellulose synthase operon protein YhjQ
MSSGSHYTLVAVVSPKGGVGKTTVAANLAATIAARGRPVLLVDLDPQNALRLHHQMPLTAAAGLSTQTLLVQPWADALFRGPFGVECLSYGTLEDRERERFEQRVSADPDWLSKGLDSLAVARGTLVIVDTPPGGSIYLQQALHAADSVIVVLLPDAASFVTLPAMARWLDEYCYRRPDFRGARFVINRMNSARTLCRDVAAGLRQHLGDRLLDVEIRFDAAVEEALASQSPIQHYASSAPAVRDFEALADRMTGIL